MLKSIHTCIKKNASYAVFILCTDLTNHCFKCKWSSQWTAQKQNEHEPFPLAAIHVLIHSLFACEGIDILYVKKFI